MILPDGPIILDPLRQRIAAHYRMDETALVAQLLDAAELPPEVSRRVTERARELVLGVRRQRLGKGGLDAFMHEYELSSQEGVVLMCLAEALLRIPDAEMADRLIRDKLGPAHWQEHLGHSDSLFVNASTWALMLTGRLVALHEFKGVDPKSLLGRLAGRLGEPVIRAAVMQAMRILGRQFVMGRNIQEALKRAHAGEGGAYRYSFDMLGETACTASDAERYFRAYRDAIGALGRHVRTNPSVSPPEISVKLSALHPRFEYAQAARVMQELVPVLATLCGQAREAGVGLTVDSEEAHRLDLTLEVFQAVFRDPRGTGWNGFGLAVQAYQKRALPLIDWLADLAGGGGRRLSVRLVKGAYWDTEIKRAQERGLDGYPVFTRKASTDVSYLACARRLLGHGEVFFPQFATHNAHTLAAVLEMLDGRQDYEFQRLHGMGEPLYEQVSGPGHPAVPCRIYAPVGSHEDLLPYLVRRLLENGSNTSFVNRIVDEDSPVEAIVADPVARLHSHPVTPHPAIGLPGDLFQPERANSPGPDLTDALSLNALASEIAAVGTRPRRAAPLVGGVLREGAERRLLDPADRRRAVGRVVEADAKLVDEALTRAQGAYGSWDATPAGERAACLERTAGLLQAHRGEIMYLAIREAGKTVPDAVAELREAEDFCRYYAAWCRRHMTDAQVFAGPTGERNQMALHGRGIFACISPWNFPLAIFTGQVAAALAAGNTVVAKPAEQTPLIAARAVALLHEAGVPPDALHLLPGDGPGVGAALVQDPRVQGVAFTGSTGTAKSIQRALAERDGPIVPLIAETGGLNAMIVDSSALPEQVVADVIGSAFHSAGQRCSALRLLFLQEDIASGFLERLAGAMAELRIGDPGLLCTDVGPVIDDSAGAMLAAHSERMAQEARLIYRCKLPGECDHGSYFAPVAFEVDTAEQLRREVFGPVLHVVRYSANGLDEVIDAINASDYGLTLGIHSRVDATVAHIHKRVRVGNTYVNRNMVGAVVGVQPFGGEGLSGTGPKAGGPHYLYRFLTERTLTVNVTAQGGNADLMSLDDD